MSQMNRRRFMEDSLIAATLAGAVGAAGPLSAQEKKAKPKPAPIKRVAPNEQINLMIVGAGGRAGNHLTAFLSDPRIVVRYLVDPDPATASEQRLKMIAEQQDGIMPKYIKDMRRGLDDKEVAALSCATTNHWHVLTGIWGLEAGKHCYLEKPLTHNLYEGVVIEAAAKKYGKVVQTGTQCRSIQSNREAVQFVHDGGIGEVKFARGLCYKRRKSIGPLGEYPVPEGIDYDLWSGPAKILPVTRPRFHYDWHWQREYGNGDSGNQGPHQFDIARWMLNLDRYPNSVITYGGRLGYQAERKDPGYVDAGDTPNTEVSIFDYGDKCLVFETRGLESKACMVPGMEKVGSLIGVIVYGSKGYVVQSRLDRQVYTYNAAFDLEGNLVKEFQSSENHIHYRNFVDAVVANDPSKVNAPARDGALSAGLAHIGNVSYYLGEKNKASVEDIRAALKSVKSLDDNDATLDRTVAHLKENDVDLAKYPLSLGPFLKFDPEKVAFEDPKAQALSTRAYRKGYEVKLS